MKKTLLFALSLLMGGATVEAQVSTIVDDDFESYNTGTYFGGYWNNWTLSADANYNIQITTDQAASGTKSGYVGEQNSAGGQDVLLKMPETYVDGKVTAEWKMYVPSGYFAYYNLQEEDSPGVSWAYDVYVNYFDSLSDGTPLSQKIVWTYYSATDSTRYLIAYGDVPLDTWFTIKEEMDLDSKTVSFYINDTLATDGEGLTWPGTLGSFGGYDFYSADATDTKSNTYYIDDVSITHEGGTSGIAKLPEQNNNLKVYPNPARDQVTLSATDKITDVEVYNLLGQRVLKTAPNANTVQLDIKTLVSGTYSATITTKEYTATKKFVVE
ncbi:MAG: T9SS type A sorting domain-containing protein [Edaphocola sp.]